MTLIGKNADKAALLRFGIPAVSASFIGAWLLLKLTGLPTLFHYELWGKEFEITPLKLIIAVLLIIFSLAEVLPSSRNFQFRKNKLFLGGVLSGFFGGLAGIQGALRSAFLIRSGLSKEAYIATGVIIASLIDITRLSVYAFRFKASNLHENLTLILSATLAAMAGALLGSLLLKKITLRFIQILVTVMLALVSVALGSGLI